MSRIPEIVIKPRKGWISFELKELWEYRELLFFLTWRNVKIKYKQSILGVGWVIFRPVISMVIFSLLFGRVAKFPSEGVPYPIFVFLGLLPWLYFSTALTASVGSLVTSSNLISKIYFPRIIIPLSANLSNLVDLFVSMSVLLVMMIWYKVTPGVGIIAAPALIVAILLASLGPGLLLGALNVRYRDVGQIIPFLVQIWMFVTPVIYPVGFIPERFRTFMYLNPMAGVVEAFRASVIGHTSFNFVGLLISLGASVLFLLVGFFYFRSVERTFADVI